MLSKVVSYFHQVIKTVFIIIYSIYILNRVT